MWAKLTGGMLLLVLLQFALLAWIGHPRIRNPWSWVASATAGLGMALVIAGLAWWWRFVVRTPSERSRAVRSARERWLAADDPADSDAKTLAVATVVAEWFHGAAIASWALLTSAAALPTMMIQVIGPSAPLRVALAAWFVAMLVAAPNRSRRESYALARLRAAGLTEDEARTLWHRALELARARPN